MLQQHKGKTCPFCQFPIKADSAVAVCKECGIPHHLECWQENGKCTTFGCKGKMSKENSSHEVLEINLEEPPAEKSSVPISEKTGRLIALLLTCGVVLLGVLIFTNISILPQPDNGEYSPPPPAVDPSPSPPAIDPNVIASLDADYYIDYENGTIPLGDLPIGARVVDPGWEWEYRLGVNYSDIDWNRDPTPPGEVRPVTWIVVARDHHDLEERHVTLLAEELIGLFAFDDSTDRDHEYAEYGYNHWGESGKGNASHGLRPWLNSTGIHSNEGLYRAFSEGFKQAVLTTTLPNREWQNGNAYSTNDNVFIPSTTELGDTDHNWTYQIGTVYRYFHGAGATRRVARIDSENWFYWTRSPDSFFGYRVRFVSSYGAFYVSDASGSAHYALHGVRPALNLKSGILLSEITD